MGESRWGLPGLVLSAFYAKPTGDATSLHILKQTKRQVSTGSGLAFGVREKRAREKST